MSRFFDKIAKIICTKLLTMLSTQINKFSKFKLNNKLSKDVCKLTKKFSLINTFIIGQATTVVKPKTHNMQIIL